MYIDVYVYMHVVGIFLIRMNLALKNCRDQCFDGASNMSGAKSGMGTQIKVEQPRAIFSHCYENSLKLAVLI